MLTRRKWQVIFLGIVAVVLAVIGAWALGLIPAQANYCDYNPYTDQKKCTVEEIAIVIIRNIGWFLNFISPAATWIATAVIGIYTVVLARVTGRQARLTRESIDLARAEFISSHRPRIIVYGLGIHGVPPEGTKPGSPIRVQFRYVNSGDSTAEITGIGTKLVFLYKETLSGDIPFEHQKIDPPIEVKIGRHGFRLTVDEFDQEQFISVTTLDVCDVVCIGYITYRDGNGTDRQMGFCRKYDFSSNRWFAMKDSEYEYSY